MDSSFDPQIQRVIHDRRLKVGSIRGLLFNQTPPVPPGVIIGHHTSCLEVAGCSISQDLRYQDLG